MHFNPREGKKILPGDFMEQRRDRDGKEIFLYRCPSCGVLTHFYTEIPKEPICLACKFVNITGGITDEV